MALALRGLVQAAGLRTTSGSGLRDPAPPAPLPSIVVGRRP